MNNIIYINGKRYNNLHIKASPLGNDCVRILVLNQVEDLGTGMVLLYPSSNPKYDTQLINDTQGTRHLMAHWLDNVERTILSN